jgi:1-acyl-sn-glycerol-3-phosphate acyltransferase
MEESLRDTRSDPYGFDWSRRKGFVWVAMKAGVPVVPIVCPRSNEIFTVYDNPLTRWTYRTLKLPLPIFRGIGPSLLPRPVELLSLVGEPIYPEVAPDQVCDADVDRMHACVVEATRSLTLLALDLDPHSLDPNELRGFSIAP